MHFIPLRLSRRATTLPLFPLREERAGERRHFCSKTLSPALSLLVPRGAREKNCVHLTFQLDYGNQVHTSKKLSMFAKILRWQNIQHPATNIQRPYDRSSAIASVRLAVSANGTSGIGWSWFKNSSQTRKKSDFVVTRRI